MNSDINCFLIHKLKQNQDHTQWYWNYRITEIAKLLNFSNPQEKAELIDTHTLKLMLQGKSSLNLCHTTWTTVLKFSKIWSSKWSKSSSISKSSSWSTIFYNGLKSLSAYWHISRLFGKSLSNTFKYISKNHTCLPLTCLLKLWRLK